MKQLKKLIIIMLCVAISMVYAVPISAAEENLVKNGQFENTDNWQINQKEDTLATMDVVNNEMQFHVERVNGNYWDVGLLQQNLKFENDQKYTLTFEAKSTIDTTTHISIENQTDWSKHLDDTIALTTSYQSYQLTFQAIDSNLAQLVFHMGETKDLNQTYYFKNVSIVASPDAIVPDKPEARPVQKIDDWTLNEADGVAGTLSGNNDEIQVEINQVNDNWWDLTVKKDNIDLKQRRLYQVDFDITSTKSGSLSFDIENTNNYNMKAIDRTALDIKEGINHYQYTFIKTNSEKETIAFHLSKGDGNTDFTGETVKIANI